LSRLSVHDQAEAVLTNLQPLRIADKRVLQRRVHCSAMPSPHQSQSQAATDLK
jgi:hypothetical protein